MRNNEGNNQGARHRAESIGKYWGERCMFSFGMVTGSGGGNEHG